MEKGGLMRFGWILELCMSVKPMTIDFARIFEWKTNVTNEFSWINSWFYGRFHGDFRSSGFLANSLWPRGHELYFPNLSILDAALA